MCMCCSRNQIVEYNSSMKRFLTFVSCILPTFFIPFLPSTQGRHEAHIVESWESPDAFPSTKGNTSRTIHAYTSAPFVELLVNNKSHGSLPVRPMVQVNKCGGGI